MWEILSRAACFIAIIVLGYVLRKKNFFQEGDFRVLSQIVLKITLPAAIVSGFAEKEIDASMLVIALFGVGASLINMMLIYWMNRRADREKRAFEVLNCAGYNIGNFALPFAQGFLGPMGVVTASLFDTGNSFICLGGSYSIARVVKGETKEFPLKAIIKTLLKSIPFDCYLIMVILRLARISLPGTVLSFAQIVGGANAFLAMLVVGVGFRLSGDRRQIGAIAQILAVRYSVAAVLALAFFFLLPLPLEMRQALVFVVFTPISSSAPVWTAELKSDVGLSSALNSVSVVCSIGFMVAVLVMVGI